MLPNFTLSATEISKTYFQELIFSTYCGHSLICIIFTRLLRLFKSHNYDANPPPDS